jgi:hypothetical protein
LCRTFSGLLRKFHLFRVASFRKVSLKRYIVESMSESDQTTSSTGILETSLVLCDCIEEWQAENLSSEGRLNWSEVAKKMSIRCGRDVSKSDIRTVWKFIAYGKNVSFSSSTNQDENETFSDDEMPFYQPLSAVKRFSIYENEGKALNSTNKSYLPNGVPIGLNSATLTLNTKVNST